MINEKGRIFVFKLWNWLQSRFLKAYFWLSKVFQCCVFLKTRHITDESTGEIIPLQTRILAIHAACLVWFLVKRLFENWHLRIAEVDRLCSHNSFWAVRSDGSNFWTTVKLPYLTYIIVHNWFKMSSPNPIDQQTQMQVTKFWFNDVKKTNG